MHDAYNVLFLCTGNSARSIIAECLSNRLGEGRIKAFSAGSAPTGRVHPLALALLEQHGFETQGLRSKSWAEFARPDAPVIDFVFTVCDNAASETCPVWAGQPIAGHWSIPDPAAVTGNETEQRRAFATAMRMLHERIGAFVKLPLGSLDRRELQARISALGDEFDSGKSR